MPLPTNEQERKQAIKAAVALKKLTPAQRKLFISAEQTKNGIKVHLRDPDAALSNIAKALGMFNEQYNITQTNIVMPPLPDDPVEAARVYAELVKGTV